MQRAHGLGRARRRGGPGEGPRRSSARRRVELAEDEQARFVYHRAEEMALAEAAKLVDRRLREALAKATTAFEAVANDAGKESPLAAVGIIEEIVSPSSLEAILRLHASIHTAEGALYRGALEEAARKKKLAAARSRRSNSPRAQRLRLA